MPAFAACLLARRLLEAGVGGADSPRDGKLVKVYLARAKPAKKVDKKQADAAGKKGKGEPDGEDGQATVSRPQVAMFVILAESNEPPPPRAKKKAK